MILFTLLTFTLLSSIQKLTSAATPHNFTENIVNEILASFNSLRRGVRASNMEGLFWNEDLANAATNFAMNCQVRSNPERASQVPGFDTVGETWSVSGTASPNYTQLIATWFSHGDSYNYETNSCTSRGNCSFYTQLVWAKNTDVGCGAVRCPSISGFPANSTLFVCYYGPGMPINAQERPFERGSPCLGCQETCSDRLCYTCTEDSSICDHVCTRRKNSTHACQCNDSFALGDDAQGCIGAVNISASTVDARTILLEWNKPQWDVDNLTQAYHILCFNGSTGFSYLVPINATTWLNVIRLSTTDEYSCCITVITSNGFGPQACTNYRFLALLRDNNIEISSTTLGELSGTTLGQFPTGTTLGQFSTGTTLGQLSTGTTRGHLSNLSFPILDLNVTAEAHSGDPGPAKRYSLLFEVFILMLLRTIIIIVIAS